MENILQDLKALQKSAKYYISKKNGGSYWKLKKPWKFQKL